MNPKITYAVAAILAGASCAAASTARAADAKTTATETNSEGLVEITVTAERRSQSMQDVPISMQAFTAQTLQQLNVATLDDYIKYLPNVSTANNGPGQNEIFMRGLSAGSQPSQGSGSTGLWPNVAIYLDNQSGQLPNRNLDIYTADLDRIEILAGPQGTLYGAGAEAGVIRYITNAPKIDVTEGNVKAGYSTTASGDPNTDLTAVLNLPLIEGTMAARGVIALPARMVAPLSEVSSRSLHSHVSLEILALANCTLSPCRSATLPEMLSHRRRACSAIRSNTGCRSNRAVLTASRISVIAR
jgi:outer membrane receptor protein involved in Fe transport